MSESIKHYIDVKLGFGKRLKKLTGSESISCYTHLKLQYTDGVVATLVCKSLHPAFVNYAENRKERLAEKAIVVLPDIGCELTAIVFSAESDLSYLSTMVKLSKIYSVDWSVVQWELHYGAIVDAGEDYILRLLGNE